MFVGHFAVGMAGKKLAPGASLAWLWFAAIFADVLWPVLLAFGAENVRILRRSQAYMPLDFVNFPWSHSLLMLVIWGALFAAFWRNVPGGKRIGLVLGALVVSHWFLDWITHKPDMPLWPGGPKYGLGLWDSVPKTVLVELAIFAIGILIYVRATWPRDSLGTWGFWIVMLLLFLAYLSDSFDRRPPRSVGSIWSGAIIASLIMIALGGFIEQHRDPRVDEEGNPVPRRVRVDLR
jgi:hypothetical protein